MVCIQIIFILLRILTRIVFRLMLITGIITFVTAILFWFLFPDSPATAWFLTPEERVIAVERIKVNQAGVENKTWKRDQYVMRPESGILCSCYLRVIETFMDPKTWLFFFFAAIS